MSYNSQCNLDQLAGIIQTKTLSPPPAGGNEFTALVDDPTIDLSSFALSLLSLYDKVSTESNFAYRKIKK